MTLRAPLIRLTPHGSSGHVPSDSPNRARTRLRRHMVVVNDKLFNEEGRAGFCALRGNDQSGSSVKARRHLRIDDRDNRFLVLD